MNYGKIENGAVTLLDRSDPSALPLIYVAMPNEPAPNGYRYESGWEQKEESIEMVWFLEEDATSEDIVNILTGEQE